ncbi:hypothetical protein C1645_519582 [Glomus cerebriforme]|uniref:SAP domain-containing protein n=1 Tax=Glomus cerebriforme TaxID=658196 RepID=A0A397TV91_9GLOM|nr:hypothetical protein C1645_519582 [Glomus cerebriforme]
MEENINTTILTPAILSSISSMKRSELQKLCKKYGLKANGKNTDLQKKIKQYALNSEGSTKDMEDIEMMDIDRSSSRNQYADSVSEPTTPQTPSAIPLEQQNKVRSSLVDDSPINIKTSESFAGDLVPMEQCLALIPYKEFIFSDLVKEQDDDTLKVAEMRINEPLVSGSFLKLFHRIMLHID